MPQMILVVEDSPDIRRLVEHILSQGGYKVTAASDGLSGWNAFGRVHPDLVLLDVNLPGIDGIELCQRIKRTSPKTPVIILTVQAEMEAVKRGLEAGANAYLAKPFEISRLMATVSNALRTPIRHISSAKGEQGEA